MEFIENIIDSSTFYYILVVITYILVILFVIMLIISRKKKAASKVSKSKDIDSIDLESVLDKMQEDVSEKKDIPKTFEQEQEEKAIISYQELLSAVKKDVSDVTRINIDEIESYDDPLEEKELPTLDSMNSYNDEPLEPIVLADDKYNKMSRSNGKFQNSEFISPIYGRVDNEIEYPKVSHVRNEDYKEERRSFESLENEDGDKFLNALKSFRNNLE